MKYINKRRVFFTVCLVVFVLLVTLLIKYGVSDPSSDCDPHNGAGSEIREFSSLEKTSQMFESTVRSCLGPKCFDTSVHGVDRVGLLALPYSGMEFIQQTISELGLAVPSESLQLVYDTNVPAYGYGKNHGWSRIIRLVRRPISQSLSILIPTGRLKSPAGALLFDAQVRQLLRWHCRLSHVAAHTRMLTVFVDDIIRRPSFELERIISFIGVQLPDRPVLFAAATALQSKLEAIVSPYENATRVLRSIDAYVVEAGINAIRDELLETKMMTSWPCKSFRNIGVVGDQLPIPSEELAANCSDRYVKCTVEFDRKGG